jgi:hypothetical protein
MWNLYNGMNCTCIICIVIWWLIPHPIVIWLTCGFMECNKDVCVRVCMCVYAYACMHACTYVCMYVCVCMHACMYVSDRTPKETKRAVSFLLLLVIVLRCSVEMASVSWPFSEVSLLLLCCSSTTWEHSVPSCVSWNKHTLLQCILSQRVGRSDALKSTQITFDLSHSYQVPMIKFNVKHQNLLTLNTSHVPFWRNWTLYSRKL